MGVLPIIVMAGLLTSRSLVERPPIPIDPARSADQISAAVADTAARSGWQVQSVGERSTKATYRLNQYVAVVVLSVEPDGVHTRYEDSENINYKRNGDKAQIHKIYYEWVVALERDMRKGLQDLCADFSSMQSSKYIGQNHKQVEQGGLFKGAMPQELVVRTSYGSATGYTVHQYSGFVTGNTQACSPISFVYFDDKLTSVDGVPMEYAALTAYSDLLAYMVKTKAIAFSDGEMERVSLEADTVMLLDAPRRAELLHFVEWQAQRFDRKETSQKEYEYLLAQKEAEVRERQQTIDQKERELKLLRRQQQLQVASLETQEQQLRAQRAQAIGQALQNIARTSTYTPPVRLQTTCTSHGSFGTVTTTCN